MLWTCCSLAMPNPGSTPDQRALSGAGSRTLTCLGSSSLAAQLHPLRRAWQAARSLAWRAEARFPAREHHCETSTTAPHAQGSLLAWREQPQSRPSVCASSSTSGGCSAALPTRDAPLPRITGPLLETKRWHTGTHRPPWAFGSPRPGTSPCAEPAAAGGCGCGGGGSDDSGDNEADEKEERSG